MDLGKSHILIMCTVGPDEVAAGAALFASHGKWMEGHSRQGDTTLLDYSISKGPELANPVDPDSAPTGDTIFVLDEFYASQADVAEHGRLARETSPICRPSWTDQQGQEGRHAAQRNGDPGPLVAAWGEPRTGGGQPATIVRAPGPGGRAMTPTGRGARRRAQGPAPA
jgi:hypothetical protein